MELTKKRKEKEAGSLDDPEDLIDQKRRKSH